MPYIHTIDHTVFGQEYLGSAYHQAIPREVEFVMRYTSGHVCVVIDLTCLVDAWGKFGKLVMQFVHRDALHPVHRPPKTWAQVFHDL